MYVFLLHQNFVQVHLFHNVQFSGLKLKLHMGQKNKFEN